MNCLLRCVAVADFVCAPRHRGDKHRAVQRLHGLPQRLGVDGRDAWPARVSRTQCKAVARAIGYLITQKCVAPDLLFVVSFTDKAVRDFMARIFHGLAKSESGPT